MQLHSASFFFFYEGKPKKSVNRFRKTGTRKKLKGHLLRLIATKNLEKQTIV